MNSRQAGKKKPKHFKKKPKNPLKLILFDLVVILLIYGGGVALSYLRFWPGTTVNGQEVGMMDATAAEEVLQQIRPEMTIITEDTGSGQPRLQTLNLEQVGYTASYDTQKLLLSQPHFDWPRLLTAEKSYKLEKSGDTHDSGKVLQVSQVIGSTLDIERTSELLETAIEQENMTVFLVRDGFLLDREMTDEEKLTLAGQIMHVYDKDLKIHVYDDLTIPISREQLEQMVTMNDDLTFTVNEEMVDEIVADLGRKYPRVNNHRRALYSGSGKIVYVGVEEDVFNYTFDADLTRQHLLDSLVAAEDTLCPVGWIRQARTIKEEDIDEDSTVFSEPSIPGLTVNEFGVGTPAGGTYIEISIDDQHLWYYEKGELILESDVITGYQGIWDTPCAVFSVCNKDEDWNLLEGGSVCDYWVGFWGQTYGIHDAYRWRTKYGSDYYTYTGSHGCVNAPLETAKELYERVEIGIPCIVYETSQGR